jgi:hypothetical protein
MIIFVFGTLIGCGSADSDAQDTGDSGDTIDESPGDCSDISVAWERVDSNGSVTTTVTNCDGEGFYLGIAETAAGEAGWYGEDCHLGGCHRFDGLSGTLAYVDDPEDVAWATSTLFDGGSDGLGDAFTAEDADRLTYVLQIVGGTHDTDCFVWGHDVTYYAADTCVEM